MPAVWSGSLGTSSSLGYNAIPMVRVGDYVVVYRANNNRIYSYTLAGTLVNDVAVNQTADYASAKGDLTTDGQGRVFLSYTGSVDNKFYGFTVNPSTGALSQFYSITLPSSSHSSGVGVGHRLSVGICNNRVIVGIAATYTSGANYLTYGYVYVFNATSNALVASKTFSGRSAAGQFNCTETVVHHSGDGINISGTVARITSFMGPQSPNAVRYVDYDTVADTFGSEVTATANFHADGREVLWDGTKHLMKTQTGSSVGIKHYDANGAAVSGDATTIEWPSLFDGSTLPSSDGDTGGTPLLAMVNGVPYLVVGWGVKIGVLTVAGGVAGAMTEITSGSAIVTADGNTATYIILAQSKPRASLPGATDLDIAYYYDANQSSDYLLHGADVYTLNAAPNAPTLVYPVGNQIFDRATAQTFDHTISDPDPGDSQSQFELRYRLAGAGTWAETLQFTTTSSEHTFAANYFAAGDYEWQVRTADAQGLYGPWSSSAFFTAANAPASPTITAPIGGETIAQESYTVEWSTPSQSHYQVRTVADAAGSPDTGTIYQDSGEVASVSTRSRLMDFPVNNRPEHVQVRVKSGGLWSAWASVFVTVSYTVPEVPTLVVTNESSAGRNFIAITNPPPGVDVPAVIENYLFRRLVGEASWTRLAHGILPNGGEYDYTVISNGSYEYKVRAIGDNGTSVESAVVAADPLVLRGSWIHDPTDPDGTIRQFRYNDTGGDDNYSDEVSLIRYAGRTAPVAEYGEAVEHSIDVELTVEVDTGAHEALRSLLRSRAILCYRDAYGRKAFFAPSGFNERRRGWGSVIPLRITDTDYSEAV